jgi:L-rhamnose mutarotase
MTELNLARCEIEDGKTDKLREWYAELHRRIDEVEETLVYEGVYTETAFIDSTESTDFLYVFMEINTEISEQAEDDEKYKIDAEHHNVLEECLIGEWEYLDNIGHYTNPELR